MKLIELGSILKIEKGKKPLKQVDTQHEGYLPYIDIEAFETGRIKSYADGEKCLPCKSGDILIVCDGSRSGFVGRAIDGYVGSTLAVISAEGMSQEYLYYFLQGKYALLNTKKKGTGTPHLDASILNQQQLVVPDEAEQKRIVAKIEEMFSQLDSAVETLLKTKAQLTVYRQAVLKEAFDGTLTAEWRKTHPSDLSAVLLEIQQEKSGKKKADKYHLEYDIPLANLPDNWKWVFVGDISKGPEYGSSQKSLKKGKVPVIRMGNLQNGEIVWDDLAYSVDDVEIEKYRLKKGDVLFNRTNSPELVGKTAIYRGEREALFAGYLIRVNQLEWINSMYLTYFLNSFTAKSYGNKVKTDGVNQSNINGTKLCSYPFPLCSSEEQRQVVYELETRLSVCDSIDQTVETALQQAEAMRQSILKKAFEGRL